MLFIPDNKGDFFNHTNRISIHIVDILPSNIKKSYPLLAGHSGIIKAMKDRDLPVNNVLPTLDFLDFLKSFNPNMVSKYSALMRKNNVILNSEELAVLMCHPQWSAISTVLYKEESHIDLTTIVHFPFSFHKLQSSPPARGRLQFVKTEWKWHYAGRQLPTRLVFFSIINASTISTSP